MAEPLLGFAAVSAVSDILQLVEFATKLSQHTYSVIKSAQDTLPANVDLEQLATRYHDVAGTAKHRVELLKSFTREEKDVLEIADDCQLRAQHLLELLEGLKLQPRHRGVKRAIHDAIKTYKAMSKMREIEHTHNRLDESNNLLTTQLLHLLVRNLDASNREIPAEMRLSTSDFDKKLVDRTDTILRALHKSHLNRVDLITKSLWFPELPAHRDAIAYAYQETVACSGSAARLAAGSRPS